jgi:hypothetical protein
VLFKRLSKSMLPKNGRSTLIAAGQAMLSWFDFKSIAFNKVPTLRDACLLRAAREGKKGKRMW